MDKFILFSFDGAGFPIAYRLQEEGNTVWVCQVKDGKKLEVKSWVTDKEEPEKRKRRLSLYDGMLEKADLDETLKMMEGIPNKDEVFVIVDHNNLCKIAEKCLEMGFTKGLFPITEDFDREKERQKSKEFVKKNYPGIIVDEVKTVKSVEEAIKFVQKSDEIWCVKSDGNFGETIVPSSDDPEMAKQEVISELERQSKDLKKGGLLLEKKIAGAIELAPQIVFWDGKPVYTQVEFETRMLGSADIGPQTGGNQNVIVNTPLDAPINKVAFPAAARELAKGRKGMMIVDAGLLMDPKDGKFHFTEFCGNRWGWGGVFSELAGARDKENYVSQYFNDIIEGKNPYKYKYGLSLALYNLKCEKKDGELSRGDLPVIITEDEEENFFMMQVKQEENARMVNVGYRTYDDGPLGYVTCYGNTLEEGVKYLYEHLKGFSFKGVYYRPEEDFMSGEYTSSIPNRMKAVAYWLGEERKEMFGKKAESIFGKTNAKSSGFLK